MDAITIGDHARLALTYYSFPVASCTVATCRLQVAFVTSTNGGASSSQPQLLASGMNLTWIALTNQGRVYVVWQDCRFEAGCGYNDMVFSTSDDGTAWSAVHRIPTDPVGSGVDHFMVADYISTSFVAGIHARTAFAAASAPSAAGALNEAMFTAPEDVHGGDVATANDPVQFVPGTPAPGVDDGGDDSDNGM